MRMVPDDDDRPLLVVYVTNTGTVAVTLTTCGMFIFPNRRARRRLRGSSNWVITNNEIGPQLPRELQPGQQWTCGFHRNDEIATAVATGGLYVGVYHAAAPLRPVLTHVSPKEPKAASN
jgi:hypothetical protein